MKRYWILFIVSILSSSLALAQMSIEEELYAFVLGIEGRTHLGRGEFIKDQLHKIGVGYITAPFKKITVQKPDTLVVEGENIIVRLGKGTKQIVVGAHYDAYLNSPGAIDNGSGVAVVLALIKHLQDTVWNYTIDFCFFDQEEEGSVGSFYYIKQFVIPKRHLAMINLDIEGLGEEVFVGPVGDNNRFIMRYIHEAVKRTGFSFVERTEYPISDHESFTNLYLESIAISIIPKGEADRLTKFVRNGYKIDSTDELPIHGILHTVDDRSNLVSSSSLKMSYEFTKTFLLLLNEARDIPPVGKDKAKKR